MKIIIPLVIFFTILTYSCESGNEPGKETKRPRDYTWIADTLQYENSSQTMMFDIWASGKNNIFVCGHNSAFMATLWHYNGSGWNRIDLFSDIEMGPHILNEIFGFPGPYNYGVWIAGERVYRNDDEYLLGRKTMILHNDGVKWEEEDIHSEGRILTVHGDRPDNVWFGGDHGRVFHWDGSNWESEVFNFEEYPDQEYEVRQIRVFDNEVYMNLRLGDDTKQIVRYFFLKGNIGEWETLDSMQIGGGNTFYKWGRTELFDPDWNKMYSCHWKVYEWNRNNWDVLVDKAEFTTSIDDIMG